MAGDCGQHPRHQSTLLTGDKELPTALCIGQSEQKCVPVSGELSPELQEWAPYSPGHSSRHSNPPLYPSRPSVGTVPRSVTPSTTMSSILRNPIYTVRSHRVGPCSSPPAARDAGPQGLHPSVQHQGRLSLDLSHRACSDYSEMRATHGSNSLPSSARLGSLSHSECSTPPQSPLNIDTLSSCSQSQTSASTLPRIAVNPASLGERRKDRPYVEEPRHVKVQKGSEPLGISIVSGEKGGIYVSKVTMGSIAHQAGLEYGDQLLEGTAALPSPQGLLPVHSPHPVTEPTLVFPQFNGINLRSATEQQARLIIGQQCDTITILAQYNPHVHQLSSHSQSSSHLDPAGTHSTLQGSGTTTPEHSSVIDPLMEQDEGPGTPPAKQSTPSSRSADVCCEPSLCPLGLGGAEHILQLICFSPCIFSFSPPFLIHSLSESVFGHIPTVIIQPGPGLWPPTAVLPPRRWRTSARHVQHKWGAGRALLAATEQAGRSLECGRGGSSWIKMFRPGKSQG
ncbi:Disks large 5 [Saguinus oedipus]|uniref:Disks large 5 n=1 Tax=Saguinus oedipus TaxID=9490 RepID=A0ABQ9UMX7_SAGOE|nr:Disks large 5 [Saguinus oedipus]